MLALRQQFLSNRPKRNRDEVMNLRQNLFGNSDTKENLSFAQEELAKAPKAFNQRWNFDVDAGTPTEGSYQWELIHEAAKQALDTSGRLTCLTTISSASKSPATSPNVFPSTSSSSSTTTRRAITTTTFSTTTTPTAVISKKCVKRLQKSVPNKAPKLITDYFKDSKTTTNTTTTKSKVKEVPDERDSSVSSRVVEILKIRSMNVR